MLYVPWGFLASARFPSSLSLEDETVWSLQPTCAPNIIRVLKSRIMDRWGIREMANAYSILV
jgi:hypothetical protein